MASKASQEKQTQAALGSSFKQKLKKLLWRVLRWVLLLLVLYQAWLFMHVWWWTSHNPTATAFMKARLHVMQQSQPNAKLQHQWVDYAHLSTNLKKAVIASEDAKFMQHQGFDWDGIEHAFKKNIKRGRIVGGGSTITQQLAKNLFLSGSRTPWRKAQEAIITLMIEKMMSKRRILEIYLNVIEWGDGIFGAQAAAKHYYQKGAGSLSTQQAAKLAVMIPRPRYYDQHRNTRYLQKRTRIIQQRLRSAVIPR